MCFQGVVQVRSTADGQKGVTPVRLTENESVLVRSADQPTKLDEDTDWHAGLCASR